VSEIFWGDTENQKLVFSYQIRKPRIEGILYVHTLADHRDEFELDNNYQIAEKFLISLILIKEAKNIYE
jgi:hypothetical protein